MPGIDELNPTFAINDAEEHCGIATNLRVFAQKSVDVVKDACRISSHVHPGKGTLQHRCQKRGTQTLAGNISDEKGRAVVAQREHVKVVASHRQTRSTRAL